MLKFITRWRLKRAKARYAELHEAYCLAAAFFEISDEAVGLLEAYGDECYNSGLGDAQ
jgi:hypothetical protein